MNNLIKAEWYRFRHSGHLFFYCFSTCLAIFIFSFAQVTSIPTVTLSGALYMFCNFCAFMIPLAYSIAIGLCIGKAYQNKTAYYEIMNGSRSSHIIISKLIVYVSFFTGITVILFGTSFIAIVICNGSGRIGQLGLRMFLFTVILFHICSVSALIALIAHSGSAPVFSFFRIILIEIFIMSVLSSLPMWISILPETYETIYVYISSYLILEQFLFLADELPLSSQFVIAVIGGTVVECIFWYIIAYFGFQKQRF